MPRNRSCDSSRAAFAAADRPPAESTAGRSSKGQHAGRNAAEVGANDSENVSLGPFLDDPRALRALAHPTRLALLDLLILHGPLTASGAGRLLGLEPNAVSFHLRQLASYGFVAEAEGGKGRQRPWRLVRPSYRWRDGSTNPELNLAGEVLSEVAIGRRIEQLRSWLVRRPDEPAGWREAAGATFSTLFLTEAELAELHDRLAKLAMTHADRLDPAQRPAGSRPVAVQIYAFPLPDDGVPEAEGRGQQVATD